VSEVQKVLARLSYGAWVLSPFGTAATIAPPRPQRRVILRPRSASLLFKRLMCGDAQTCSRIMRPTHLGHWRNGILTRRAFGLRGAVPHHAYKPSIVELRLRLERRVRAAHAHTQVGVAIGRGSDFYGPPANSAALVIRHTTSLIEGMTFRIA
jgi:hypothetical protein